MACTQLALRPADAARDFEALCALEAASYPPDEAATPAKFEARLAAAGPYFKALDATLGDGSRAIIGLVTGTRTRADFLDHASMSSHAPDGASLCLHSVVVAAPYRRKGIASWMLQTYLRQVLWEDAAQGSENPIRRVLLLAHADKTSMYARLGFVSRGPSPVVHGAETWMEMALDPAAVFGGEGVGLPLPCRIPFSMVDAFLAAGGTSSAPRKGSGNPAAVVVLPTPMPLTEDSPQAAFPLCQATMVALATELAVPATAFLVPRYSPSPSSPSSSSAVAVGWSIRYFNSVGTELPVCGHASLAAARALFAGGYVPPCETSVTLLAKAAVLRVASSGEEEGADWGRYALTLPADACAPPADEAALRTELVVALGLSSPADLTALSRGRLDLVACLTPDAMARFQARVPDYSLLRTGALGGIRILTVTSFDAAAGVATTRCFNAAANPPEDPACGAAHCTLGSYLAVATGARRFVSNQTSPRGAFFDVVVEMGEGGGAPAAVTLTGAAGTVSTGSLAEAVTAALLAQQ